MQLTWLLFKLYKEFHCTNPTSSLFSKRFFNGGCQYIVIRPRGYHLVTEVSSFKSTTKNMMQTNKHHTEHTFHIGEMVSLKLQPYCQNSSYWTYFPYWWHGISKAATLLSPFSSGTRNTKIGNEYFGFHKIFDKIGNYLTN